MRNFTFGYARVSTEAQNLDRQLDALEKYGVDKIYNEKMTGTKRDRPELEKMLERMTEGDTVVIESLSRLGRSTKDLIELVELFEKRGVHLVSLKEQIDTTTSTGKLLFTLMSAIAQFERDTIADREQRGQHQSKELLHGCNLPNDIVAAHWRAEIWAKEKTGDCTSPVLGLNKEFSFETTRTQTDLHKAGERVRHFG